MKYKIIIETEVSGKKWYYVKRRYLLYFWRYLNLEQDMSMCAHRIGWNSLDDAEKHILSDIYARYRNDQKKIIKREYIIK
jgi:hypothetical protein